jgi:hypothetical protein
MGGTSKSTQQTQQSSTTNPWEPTQGILKDILGGIQGQVGNYQPTAAETTAINQLKTNAANLPNYTPQATSLASDYLTGGPDRSRIVGDAYNSSKAALSPYLSPDWLDPTKVPGIAAALDTVRNDVRNSVGSTFAGAGRDLSGLHMQSLARGISQGEAPVLLDAFFKNAGLQQNAAATLPGIANNTATTQSSLDQASLTNRAQGLNVGLNTVPQAANASANGVLNAENLLRTLPLQNLQALASLVVPIAGLGGQSYGTSNTTGTQTMSPAQQFATIMGGLNSGFGGAGGGGVTGLMRILSDRRAKDDIKLIGELYDGTPIYRFRYKGDPRVIVGLMADDVERYVPSAVVEVGGYKMVDYDAATQRAASMRDI